MGLILRWPWIEQTLFDCAQSFGEGTMMKDICFPLETCFGVEKEVFVYGGENQIQQDLDPL